MHNTGFLNGFQTRLNFLNIKRIPSMEIITLNNYVIGRYSQLSHIDLLITVGLQYKVGSGNNISVYRQWKSPQYSWNTS